MQAGDGGEEGEGPGGLKRRTSTRERAKPVAYNPREQDLDTARRRKELKEQVRPDWLLYGEIEWHSRVTSAVQPTLGGTGSVRCAVVKVAAGWEGKSGGLKKGRGRL